MFLGWSGEAPSAAPFERKYCAAYNTVLYRAPTTLGPIEGPAGVSPALLTFTPPDIGWWRLSAQLTAAVRFLTLPDPPNPVNVDFELRLQARINAGAWGTPFWIGGDAASGNGRCVHRVTGTALTELDESFAVCADHVFQTTAPGDTVSVRGAWVTNALGYVDVVSSWADESFANGGWQFEAWLAEAVAPVVT